MFTPKYVSKYGYQYRATGQGPRFAMFHAWLGCRRAVREKRRARGLTPLAMHSLVFKGPTTADQDGSSTSAHCFCGGLTGQWIEGRDNVETWFEYVETKPELNDIEAAQAARIEFEREQVITMGGGVWSWETIDVSPWATERRRVYKITDEMKADLCTTCQHPRTLHEGQPTYRGCMGRRTLYREVRDDTRIMKVYTEKSYGPCACRYFTMRADEPKVTSALIPADEERIMAGLPLSGLSAKIRQRRQEMRTEEVATGRVKRARTDEGEV